MTEPSEESSAAPETTGRNIRRKVTLHIEEMFGNLFEHYGVAETTNAIKTWYPELLPKCEEEADIWEEDLEARNSGC